VLVAVRWSADRSGSTKGPQKDRSHPRVDGAVVTAMSESPEPELVGVMWGSRPCAVLAAWSDASTIVWARSSKIRSGALSDLWRP
jgi:hypothetical protein